MKNNITHIIAIILLIIFIYFSVPSPQVLPEIKNSIEKQSVMDEFGFLFKEDK